MGLYIPDLNLQKPNLLDGPHVYSAYILAKPGERSVIVVDNEDGESSEKYEIIPVPPHGRLINADARVNVQMYNDEFEDFQAVNMSIDDLLDSSWIELEDDPTIIPAEPAKEAQP